jgi:energy-coupling factor transport system substrate-specific component
VTNWAKVQVGVCVLVAFGVLVYGSIVEWDWYFIAIAMAAVLTYAGLTAYESMAVDPKNIALVATLGAVSSIGRVVVQGIPDAEPATFLVLMSGFSFGPVVGAVVGALTALGSNLILGEGIWTPWQMVAWGLVGFSAGLLRRMWPSIRIRWLIPFAVVCGYAFGWFMNIQYLLGESSVTWKAYLAACVASFFPFDTTNAVVTAGLVAIAGYPVYQIFERFRKRMVVTRLDSSGGYSETGNGREDIANTERNEF